MEFEINFWATDLHGPEIGIKQKQEWMAKSRQFTRDMEIFGEWKSENDKGIVAYRRKLLEEKGLLVIKMFSDSGRWIGSIEELEVESLKRSLLANRSLLSYAVIISGYDYVIRLDQLKPPVASKRERFAFAYTNDKGTFFFSVSADIISLGKDFTIIMESGNHKVGKIDSKVFDIGGKVHVSVNTNEVPLMLVIVLFAATLKFSDVAYERLSKMIKELSKKTIPVKARREEMDLYKNPRMVRM